MTNHQRLRGLGLLVAAVLVGPALAADQAYPLTSDSNCGCYRTNATTANYFAHHHFFDFRNLGQYAKKPDPLGSFEANARAPPTSQYFASQAWTSTWDIQTWNNTQLMKMNNSDLSGSDATVTMVNSPNNIYIERNSDLGMSNQTYMTMRTVRHSTFQSASEIESSSQGYQFLSIRMFARTKGAPGAVTAMFTYRPGPNQNLMLVQEADLEIRTRDPPSYVQYTNQPSWNATSDIPQATRNVSMPGGRRWSDWAHFRMDWTPGSSTWYVNGQLSGAIQFQAPRDPAQVMFNSWSDGGSWSGNMPVNQEASLQIQWIEMVYNNTDPGAVKTGKCVNVCSIDETTQIGQPVLLGGNGNQQPPAPGSGSGGSSGGQTGQPGRPGGGQGGNGGNGGNGGQGGGQSGRPGSGQGGNGGNGGQGTNQPGACAAAKYAQCAGKNFNGCKACAAGTTCRFQNDYYSQCL